MVHRRLDTGSVAKLRLLIPLDPVASWVFAAAPQKQLSWGTVGDKGLRHLLGTVSPVMLPFAQQTRLSLFFAEPFETQRKDQLTSPFSNNLI